jgi:hypothetical protein
MPKLTLAQHEQPRLVISMRSSHLVALLPVLGIDGRFCLPSNVLPAEALLFSLVLPLFSH